MPVKTLLEQLREQRKSLIDELGALIEARETARGEFTALTAPTDEQRSAHTGAEDAFVSEFKRLDAEIKPLTQRVDEQELLELRRAEAAVASRSEIRVTSEPATYREDNQHKVSYFRDLACAQIPAVASRMDDPNAAVERLNRHAAEMNVELPKRDADRERRGQEKIDAAEHEFRASIGARNRGFDESPFERRTNPSRTDGQGGYFVPPLWLIDDYIPALRAGRATADMCRGIDLPEGTDSINIPKLSTPTLTGVQTADNATGTSQDFTDTSVSAGVKTIEGHEDVAIQLVEQSPGQIIDRVIIEDLMADYNKRVDVQVIQGTNANGQVCGLLPQANWGIGTVTWTTSTPLGQAFNQACGAGWSKVASNRFDVSNVAALMVPRRWAWFATALDGASGTSGRPLVNRQDVGFNVSAVNVPNVPAQGEVGVLPFGPSVNIDGNLPIVATAGGAVTGGTSDLALIGKWDDAWLFEGSLRTRALAEVLSGTLQIRFQVFNYIAFLVRYGESFAVIQGTGMAAPTSASDTSITY